MATPFRARITTIDQGTLTPLVRRALGKPSAVVSDWQYEQIHRGAGDFGAGIYGVARFSGMALDQGTELPWSLVLKVLPLPNASHDPFESTRELCMYQSGILDDLPGNIAAPHCYEASEVPGEAPWLWLEEIVDEIGTNWPLSQYGTASRHLGQFNGAFLTELPLPSTPWLTTPWLRHWAAKRSGGIDKLRNASKNLLMQRLYPPHVAEQIFQIWEHRGQLLDAVTQIMPQTLCHRDAFRRNLFARYVPDIGAQTVAIDWAYTGIGAVGEDLAPLVWGSLGFRDVPIEHARELEDTVFNSYMDGLRDAGWNGDPRLVRFGYAAASVLRYGFPLELDTLLDESRHEWTRQVYGAPAEVLVEVWSEIERGVLRLADEAWELLPMFV